MRRQGMRGGCFLWAMVLGMVPLIAGCAAPLLGGITLNHIVAATSATTTAWSGKGLSELALDRVTGKDCRFLDGALREDRDLCERHGSVATEKDFKGVVSVVDYIRDYRDGDGDIAIADEAALKLGAIETAAGAPDEVDDADTPFGKAASADPNPFAFQRNVVPVSYRRDF